METKTIGAFIATLRRAAGMTQRELAERLNVSDKTVSRWERNEGTPDLSLIPVIAEIFGVTCDELLRGERRPTALRAEDAGEPEPTPKGEKQRQRLLAVSLSRYKARTLIAAGVSAAGLIAAMVGNFGFLRARLGFCLAAVFYLVAVICQAVFLNSAFLSVSDDSLPPFEAGRFRWTAIRLAQRSLGLTAVLLGGSLPLLDTYHGLSAVSWLLWGGVCGGAALILTAAVCWLLNHSLLKRGAVLLAEKELLRWQHRHRLKRSCSVGLAAVVLATFVAHMALTTLWGPRSIMSGTTFYDYESFVAYMEQDIPHTPVAFGGSTPAVQQVAPADSPIYYDADGNEISEDEARRRTLEDLHGNVVCEYIQRNESVVSIRYSPGEGTALPVTVHTDADLRQAQARVRSRNALFGIVYVLEAAAVLALYLRKRNA